MSDFCEGTLAPQNGENVSYISLKYSKCRSQMSCGLVKFCRCCGYILALTGLSYSLAFGKLLLDGGCYWGWKEHAVREVIDTGWFNWMNTRTVTCAHYCIMRCTCYISLVNPAGSPCRLSWSRSSSVLDFLPYLDICLLFRRREMETIFPL